MNSMFLTVVYSLIVMVASLSGVFFLWRGAGRFLERNLSFLVSFSAGVFLVVVYEIMAEVVFHSLRPTLGLAWIIIGTVGVWLVFKFLPGLHHHHEGDSHCCHQKLDARRVLFADALHNVGDGLLLSATILLSPALGLVTALSIFAHEFVQEVSEFFVLRQAGFSQKKAIALNFLVSFTILLGSLGGYFLLSIFQSLEGPLLGLAAGSFIVVILQDLLPHSVQHSQRERVYVRHLIWFSAGLLIMLGVNNFFGHVAEESEPGLDHLAGNSSFSQNL